MLSMLLTILMMMMSLSWGSQYGARLSAAADLERWGRYQPPSAHHGCPESTGTFRPFRGLPLWAAREPGKAKPSEILMEAVGFSWPAEIGALTQCAAL